MNKIIDLSLMTCDCCGEEFEESELTLVDMELVCFKCEDDYSDAVHTSNSRLSVKERN